MKKVRFEVKKNEKKSKSKFSVVGHLSMAETVFNINFMTGYDQNEVSCDIVFQIDLIGLIPKVQKVTEV